MYVHMYLCMYIMEYNLNVYKPILQDYYGDACECNNANCPLALETRTICNGDHYCSVQMILDWFDPL